MSSENISPARVDGSGVAGSFVGRNSNVVVIERILGGLGDLVMARPAVNAYIQQNPDKEVYLLASEPYDQIWYDIPCKAIIYNNIADKHIHFNINSPCLDYEMENHPFLLSKRSLTNSGKMIESSRQEIFCNALGVKFDINNYNVKFSDEEILFADKYCKNLHNIIAMHCNSNEPSRNYKYEKSLLEYASSHWDGHILAIRAKERVGNKNIIYWEKDGDVRDLWSVFTRITAFIGVDSGPIHMAGAVEKPVYGIFGPIDPSVRLKYKNAFWSDIKCRHTNNKYCWYLPCKQTYCMSRLPSEIFKDAINCFELSSCVKAKPHRTSLSKSKVGLAILEGLGGTITATDYAYKLNKYAGIKPDIYIRKHVDIFKKNPNVSSVYTVGGAWYDALTPLYSKYDSFIVCKTVIGKVIGEKIFHDNFTEFADIFHKLPEGMCKLESYGLNLIQLLNYSLGIYDHNIDTKIYFDKKYNIPFNDYIVVSNGVDTDHYGAVLTKSWNKWDSFANQSKLNVVQVGTNLDKYIDGSYDLRGKTPISELFYVVKKANAIVCQEGGLMHIAKAVGNDNIVVVRGPTRGHIFSYPGQKLVDADICEPCFFKEKMWDIQCITGQNCMNSISVDRVIESLRGIL